MASVLLMDPDWDRLCRRPSIAILGSPPAHSGHWKYTQLCVRFIQWTALAGVNGRRREKLGD